MELSLHQPTSYQKKMLVYLIVSFGNLFVELKFVAYNLEN
jgi:hypothetical protein